MGKLLTFFFLAQITGSPWKALLIILVGWWILDRSTLRYTPGPWAYVKKLLKRRELEAALAHNPSDFRNELELGRILLEAKKWPAAKAHLDRAADAYQTDASVQVLRAVARIGCGERDAGLAEVESLMGANPRLRFGEPYLDAGELVLASGDAARAKALIEKFLQSQPSNVKGNFLLAKALAKSGDLAGAKAARSRAWHEYATSPAFKRREGRMWAYRANPLRPMLYMAGIFAAIGAAAAIYSGRV